MMLYVFNGGQKAKEDSEMLRVVGTLLQFAKTYNTLQSAGQ